MNAEEKEYGESLEYALAETGLTYRQLDYWSRKGWLRPEGNNRGSGNHRHWPQAELRIARTMGRLIDAGLMPEAAHRVARGEQWLADGIRIEVDAA